MQIKIFGKNLFEYRSRKQDALFSEPIQSIRESKYIQDFYGISNSGAIENWAIVENMAVKEVAVQPKEEKAPEKSKEKITPKGVYTLKLLNDETFKLNVDPKYIDEQVQSFKDKLSVLNSEEYDMRRGVQEVASILLRMENRKKYKDVSKFFEQFPYTTTVNIESVIKKHDHLKIGQLAQFIADMPNEAIKIMKEYDSAVGKLCGKKAVFYIIADKKDFKKTENRRDPILVAQSPFGHFWQILGAWDKEMVLLEEL